MGYIRHKIPLRLLAGMQSRGHAVERLTEITDFLRACGFKPGKVALRKLTRIPLQMVWGDHVDASESFSAALVQSKRFVELVNKYGGNAEVLMLRDAGLTGNTHIPFADLNNVDVANLLSEFLSTNGLDAYGR